MATSAVGATPGETVSPLQRSLDLLRVAECDVFTGSEEGRTPWGRVFGGQVLAQSLVAAQRTVESEMRVHSLHGYFLLAGESGVELLFEVERVRDGQSFATRVVKALQRNKAIFQMNVSFHRDEWGPSFQTPGREFNAIFKSRGVDMRLPEELLAQGNKLFTPTSADLGLGGHSTEAISVAEGKWWSLRWCRHKHRLPDWAHESIFAWITDSWAAEHVTKPHGAKGQRFSMVFSLDHSIHFHKPFRADEWLLFSTRTTVSNGARGLARTEVFTTKGSLVATVTQEALIRVPKEDQMAHTVVGGVSRL